MRDKALAAVGATQTRGVGSAKKARLRTRPNARKTPGTGATTPADVGEPLRSPGREPTDHSVLPEDDAPGAKRAKGVTTDPYDDGGPGIATTPIPNVKRGLLKYEKPWWTPEGFDSMPDRPKKMELLLRELYKQIS